MTTTRDDSDGLRRRSLRLQGIDPLDPDVDNERDNNPPPPDESESYPDLSQPLLSPPPSPAAPFTVVGRTRDG